MNELDARIDRMSAALRDEPMPAAPAGTMVAGRSRLRFAGRIAIVACAAVVAVAGAAVALYPRDSAAAVFERIVQSADSKPCRWICYDLEPNGAWKVTQDIYRDQSRFHSTHPDGGETYIEHGYWYMLSRDKSYVVVEPVKLRPGHSPFGRPSLREQLGFQNVEWVKDAGTAAWKGMILERYNVHSEIKREGGGIIDLDGFTLADPKSDLPYYSITTESGDLEGLEYQPRSSAMEWQYPKDADAELTMKLPKGIRVYEPEKLRGQVPNEVTRNRATCVVDGIKVTLRAVYAHDCADTQWPVDVFITGGTGAIEDNPPSHLVKIDGRAARSDGGGDSIQNLIHLMGGTWQNGGRWVSEPLHYRGLDLLQVQGDFGPDFHVPDKFNLEVPIWKADSSRYGRHFVGYAKFINVRPIRYEGHVLAYHGSVLWSAKDKATQQSYYDAAYGKQRGPMKGIAIGRP